MSIVSARDTPQLLRREVHPSQLPKFLGGERDSAAAGPFALPRAESVPVGWSSGAHRRARSV